MIFVGTSGWQYDHWRGTVYAADDPKRIWLERYADRFAVVEVNNSFYRLPSQEVIARWRAETPDGFTFAVKASRFITHVRRLREPEGPVRLLWSRIEGLGRKRGPVLFQLPPRFPAAPDRLEALLEVLPRGMRAAFEFRDPSWETVEVFELLDRRRAALVLADRPLVHVRDVVTGGWAYVRFHRGRERAPGYTREKLRRWADRMMKLDATDAYAFFNNDEDGAAVRDALTLTELLRRRGADVAGPAGSGERARPMRP